MRISELHEGFVDSFKKGYSKTAPGPSTVSTPARSADIKQSVFSALDPRDTKKNIS